MKLTIRNKLLINAAAAVAFAAIIGGVGYWAIVTLDHSMDTITGNAKAMRSHMTADMAHDGLNGIVHAAALAAVTNDLGRKQELYKNLDETSKEFRDGIAEIKTMDNLDSGIRKKADELDRPLAAYLDSATRIVHLSFENKDAHAVIISNICRREYAPTISIK